MRTSINALPTTPTYCHSPRRCPYRDQHLLCDMRRINKGNSDAARHRVSNKAILGFLSNRQDRVEVLGAGKTEATP